MKTLVATVALAALLASPALAQTSAQRARAQQAQPQANQGLSIESRTTGHERTCGHADYQYDSEGTPIGPYCH
jgi:Ni/Co efflux regulator RcnB